MKRNRCCYCNKVISKYVVDCRDCVVKRSDILARICLINHHISKGKVVTVNTASGLQKVKSVRMIDQEIQMDTHQDNNGDQSFMIDTGDVQNFYNQVYDI